MKRYVIIAIASAAFSHWIPTVYAEKNDVFSVSPPITDTLNETIYGTGFIKASGTDWFDTAQKKAARGDLGSQFIVGRSAYISKDYEGAIIWYTKVATHPLTRDPKENDYIAGAQEALALMYLQGDGVKQNYIEALKWLRKLATQNNNWAEYNIGAMYFNGWGIRQDKNLAKKWFGKACDHGNQNGCALYRKLNEAGY